MVVITSIWVKPFEIEVFGLDQLLASKLVFTGLRHMRDGSFGKDVKARLSPSVFFGLLDSR